MSSDSLKRLAPAAVRWCRSPRTLEVAAYRQNATTHHGAEAEQACVLFARLLYEAIWGKPIDEVLRARRLSKNGRVAEVVAGSWRGKKRDKIQSTDCLVHTLEAGLWATNYGSTVQDLCVKEVSPFRQSVLAAVNLGGDANSIGAVTGQLAGALWGLSGIPPEWVETLAHSERIIQLAKDLYDPSRRGRRGDWRLSLEFDPEDVSF